MWTIAYDENQMVSRHAGALPVLLTCPHGAPVSAQPPGVTQRTTTAGCRSNKLNGDTFTREIATGVAQLLLETLGESPYVVMAGFHRKFIDANREPKCAFNQAEAAIALPFYNEYHQTIRGFIDEIQAQNGTRGFLFDIHGTTVIDDDKADLYIGTDNGNSVVRLFTADPFDVLGRRSLRGLLQAAGYVISPAVQSVSENPQVDGGFTTQTYGSSHPDGLNAMQLEIAQPVRQDAQRRQPFIEHLGRAIASLSARLL